MFGIIDKLFGGPDANYKALVAQGAQIIDVRTRNEYSSGHIVGSTNIPLQELGGYLDTISKEKPVITCCASGMRSGSAKSMLQKQGYEVYNGGGWMKLQGKIV